MGSVFVGRMIVEATLPSLKKRDVPPQLETECLEDES